MTKVSRGRVYLTLCLLGSLGACALGPSLLVSLPADEVAQLPQDCTELLAESDGELAWARAEGNDGAIVLGTPHGACVQERAEVLRVLRTRNRIQTAALIAHDFSSADPAPHPDIPVGVHQAGPWLPAEPGNSSADPSPHPDKGKSSQDGHDPFWSLFIVR